MKKLPHQEIIFIKFNTDRLRITIIDFLVLNNYHLPHNTILLKSTLKEFLRTLHASLLSMSAIQKINNSGLSSEEKDNLKVLIWVNVEIKNQIIENDQVTDTLFRKYLQCNYMSV